MTQLMDKSTQSDESHHQFCMLVICAHKKKHQFCMHLGWSLLCDGTSNITFLGLRRYWVMHLRGSMAGGTRSLPVLWCQWYLCGLNWYVLQKSFAKARLATLVLPALSRFAHPPQKHIRHFCRARNQLELGGEMHLSMTKGLASVLCLLWLMYS